MKAFDKALYLSLEHLNFAYGNVDVLKAIDLAIFQGEILCLLGESGSGKTTLMRLIAGLEQGYQGTIRLDGQVVDAVPVHERGFGLMFQDFALFPHLNVAGNIAFGLKMQNIAHKEQAKLIAEVLALVGLSGYEAREIHALSGGQKQRIALARSLAPKPRLLMLDEPLASLDAGLRESLVQDLRGIIKKIGLTAIYVTHDQQEAYSIADRIAIMNQGRIEQIDSPEMLYHQPKTAFVARFLGLSNLIPAAILNRYISTPNDAKFFLIHPENLKLDEHGAIEGILREKVFQGDSYRLKVEIADGFMLSLRLPSTEKIPEINQEVRLSFDNSKLIPMSNL
jgi:thiamine transport system ATP-binding protein